MDRLLPRLAVTASAYGVSRYSVTFLHRSRETSILCMTAPWKFPFRHRAVIDNNGMHVYPVRSISWFN